MNSILGGPPPRDMKATLHETMMVHGVMSRSILGTIKPTS